MIDNVWWAGPNSPAQASSRMTRVAPRQPCCFATGTATLKLSRGRPWPTTPGGSGLSSPVRAGSGRTRVAPRQPCCFAIGGARALGRRQSSRGTLCVGCAEAKLNPSFGREPFFPLRDVFLLRVMKKEDFTDRKKRFDCAVWCEDGAVNNDAGTHNIIC